MELQCLMDEPMVFQWQPTDDIHLLYKRCVQSNEWPEKQKKRMKLGKILIPFTGWTNFVSSTLDVHESSAFCQCALQANHNVTMHQRIEVWWLCSCQNFRWWSLTSIQCLTKFIVITSVGIIPNRLSHHVNLKATDEDLKLSKFNHNNCRILTFDNPKISPILSVTYVISPSSFRTSKNPSKARRASFSSSTYFDKILDFTSFDSFFSAVFSSSIDFSFGTINRMRENVKNS